MSLSLDFLALFIICIVIVFWSREAVDLLKRELSRSGFTKWLTIVIVMQAAGFLIYIWMEKHRHRV